MIFCSGPELDLKWCSGRDCVQSFGKTELGHTHTKENYESQLCYTETGIDAVQKSIFDLGVSVAKATEIRRVQLSELVTQIPYIAGATESPKLAANMVNTKVPLSALSSPTPPEVSLSHPPTMECLLTMLSPSRTGFRQTARQLPWRTWLSACSVPGTVDGPRRTSIDERLRALGEQCFADVGEGDMDGGQIEVECVRWGLFVGLFRSGCIPMPDTVQESLS